MQNITIKRLKGEINDLSKNKSLQFQAFCEESDIFTFYFILRDLDEPYKGGYYIGKILLPVEYPTKAGDIMMLTPNGRFEIGKKICLSNSGYHPESWSPMWTIRNMLIGFVSIFLDDEAYGISHIKEPTNIRIKYAQDSVNYNITYYSAIFRKFNYFVNEDLTIKSNDEIDCIINNKPIKFKLDINKLDDYTFNDFIKYFKGISYDSFNNNIYRYFSGKF